MRGGKKFTNELNIGLPLWARIKKTVDKVKTHWLFSKEKILDTVISKEGHADSLLEQERTHHYWFLWKSATVNSASYC